MTVSLVFVHSRRAFRWIPPAMVLLGLCTAVHGANTPAHGSPPGPPTNKPVGMRSPSQSKQAGPRPPGAGQPGNVMVIPTNGAATNQSRDAEALDWSYITGREFCLTALVLVFGLFILICQNHTLGRQRQLTADEVTRSYAVSLLVIASLVLVVAGYRDSQIAPAIGLFGTLAGYLLGKSSSANTVTPPAENNDADRER
jgi:hypothetical protein